MIRIAVIVGMFTAACCVAVSSPGVDTPAPKGDYVTRNVPNTVDLSYSSELAINALTRTNTPASYDTYFISDMTLNPPRFSQSHPQEKYWEALTLLRLLTGNRANLEVDRVWARRTIDTPKGPYTGGLGRLLPLCALYYRISKDSKWLECGKEMAKRMDESVTTLEDFSFFPPINPYMVDPSGKEKLEDYKQAVPTGWPATFSGWKLQGLAAFYRNTRDEASLDLAGRLARFLRYHAGVISEDGGLLARHNGYLGPKTALHFHHNTNTALGLTEYSLASGDRSYAEFAKRAYEWARAAGNRQIGYFPEYIKDFPDDRKGIIDCEGCCVADMVALALKLTEAGVADYWDDVDCYTRNMLTEMQLKDRVRLLESVKEKPVTPVNPEEEDAFQADERMIGTFAGWCGPNQFSACNRGVMSCCTGNCSRALYYVWDHMLKEEGDTVTFELLLNRVSTKVDLLSDLPYRGRVTVFIREPCTVQLRKPSWPDSTTVKIRDTKTGESSSIEVNGEYLNLGPRSATAELELTFQLPERTIKEQVGHVAASMTIRGNEVVAFDPPGEGYRFWLDKPGKETGGPHYVVRTYFIPRKRIHW